MRDGYGFNERGYVLHLELMWGTPINFAFLRCWHSSFYKGKANIRQISTTTLEKAIHFISCTALLELLGHHPTNAAWTEAILEEKFFSSSVTLKWQT